ncbi:MAG: hypothetical protein JO284_04165 [Planctomycetaceae bacterium]|jgi:hypothetical protein|nr:hypothetical protein [Planctomycetaceae bacterium]MBV8607411.1 hypothetical protein [Singulisphaera sp.]MBV8230884.1 hypothetical protein [Planctomycetaceae bacterium]MBV8267992.1 hypothetical protein [Planctomycetaceae bacterium]MBV8316121.1 hypothetical protein [Planctomycetaceae bacterium]
MTRSLVAIGVALIDAGAQPDITRWLIELLGSTQRVYLPRPQVVIDGRQTLVRFELDERRLTVVTDRIGRAWWRRDYPDGTVDEGFIGPTSPECIPRLFDWLLDQTVSRV